MFALRTVDIMLGLMISGAERPSEGKSSPCMPGTISTLQAQEPRTTNLSNELDISGVVASRAFLQPQERGRPSNRAP